MKFIDLEIGKFFVFTRDKNKGHIWKKINCNKHNNAMFDKELCSVHGCTQVEVIR